MTQNLFGTLYVAGAMYAGAIAFGMLVDFVEEAAGHKPRDETRAGQETRKLPVNKSSSEESDDLTDEDFDSQCDLQGTGSLGLEVFADYQFPVADVACMDSQALWSDQAIADCLLRENQRFCVGTQGAGLVKVRLKVVGRGKQLRKKDAQHWDRINECSIFTETGRLAVGGQRGSKGTIAWLAVSAKTFYRARIFYANEKKHYKVVLWQESQPREFAKLL